MAKHMKAGSYNLWLALNGTGKQIMTALGYSSFPHDHNPVWEALSGLSPLSEREIQGLVAAGEMREDEAARLRQMQARGTAMAAKIKPLIWKGKSPNKKAIMLAYVLAQTNVLDSIGGPIGTGVLASIRQRWYASKNERAMGFKFAAQALERYLVQSADVVLVDGDRSAGQAQALGAKKVLYKTNWKKPVEKMMEKELGRPVRSHIWPKSGWGRAYSQFQSQLFADLVRDGLTYNNLWVADISRDVEGYQPLFRDFYACLLLEKQGLFPHFQGVSRALGIPRLVAMSGNNSFASVEALLDNGFRDWEGRYTPTADNPIHLFVISDHDYAGMVPVQEGAVSQFRRYLGDAVKVHRIGVTKAQLDDEGLSLVNQGYIFDDSYNSAYAEWADVEGIWTGEGESRKCYGIEVEALTPEVYVKYIVDAIIDIYGEDEFVEKMLKLAEPNWYEIKRSLTRKLYEKVRLHRLLEKLGEWIDTIAYEIESRAGDKIEDMIEGNLPPWSATRPVALTILNAVEAQRDNVTAEKFTEYGKNKQAYSQWRPVDGSQANDEVESLFIEGAEIILPEDERGWCVFNTLGEDTEHGDLWRGGFETDDDAYYALQTADDNGDLEDFIEYYSVIYVDHTIEVDGREPEMDEWAEDYAEDNDDVADLLEAMESVFSILSEHDLDDPDGS